uniref:Secreted protein n=1 Tax=Parascaris equorum TaxID=6256 RepID=A0A914R573_PAREQ
MDRRGLFYGALRFILTIVGLILKEIPMSWCARATTSTSCVFAYVRRLQSTTAGIAELNRSFADGCAHVKSTNVENGERCVLRLQLANGYWFSQV